MTWFEEQDKSTFMTLDGEFEVVVDHQKLLWLLKTEGGETLLGDDLSQGTPEEQRRQALARVVAFLEMLKGDMLLGLGTTSGLPKPESSVESTQEHRDAAIATSLLCMEEYVMVHRDSLASLAAENRRLRRRST